jgi:hypothetical protein
MRPLVFVEAPPVPITPEIVTVSQFLPDGNTVKSPPSPIRIATNAITANIPLHDLFPSNPIRGLLEAARVNSSKFNPPGLVTGDSPP